MHVQWLAKNIEIFIEISYERFRRVVENIWKFHERRNETRLSWLRSQNSK